MRITLIDAGKRFNRDWIFRHLHYQFHTGHSYAITGPNGSGKSTLLQAIAGAIDMSEGKAEFYQVTDSVPTVAFAGLPGSEIGNRTGNRTNDSERTIAPDQVYKYLPFPPLISSSSKK